MPRSKRDKVVVLTKTKKKGRPLKEKLIEDIRKSVDSYKHCFVFTVENTRGTIMKDIRLKWRDSSRFFLGKVKVMAMALGRIRGEEYKDNLHKVSKNLIGQTGLCFTNLDVQEVMEYFDKLVEMDYARSGVVATETIALPLGPMDQEIFPFSMEPFLRKLGLPTNLQKGTVCLLEEYTVCKKGVALTPEQAKILKLLGKPMAEFRVKLLCVWTKCNSNYTSFVKKNKKSDEVMEME